MTIHVKAGKVRLHLWLPTSILKSRFGYNFVKRAIDDNAQAEQDEQDESVSITREQIKEIYNTLKRYVKANGHFNLLEVESHDGEKVKIRV